MAKNENDKKIRGFATLINSILIPLNENKVFREKFKEKKGKILLNASNLNYAALVVIENGIVKVTSIPNKPKSNLKKKIVRWNAFLEMDTHTFLLLAINQISPLVFLKKWLNHKIKIRGILKLLLLFKIFKFLIDYKE